MKRTVGDFMFAGLRVAHDLKDKERQGQLASPRHLRAADDTTGVFAPVPASLRISSLRMQKSYRVMFVFENLVRELIVEQMSEKHGANWFNKVSTPPMKKKHQDRLKEEEKNGWHQGVETYAIYYLDFGDLGRMIRNHWQVFKEFFPDQAWVENRMREAERCRNVVAHSKQLGSEDQSRLEMHLKDWINQVC